MSVSKKLVSLSYVNNIPLFVTIELTKRCCNNCVFCYIDNKFSYDMLNIRNIEKILYELKKLGTIFITFTGGEIFLREDIEEIFKLCYKIKFNVRIFSSLGIECENKLKVAYKYGVRDIEVSLHGRKQVHNKTTDRDCFDVTLKNIFIAKNIGFRIIIKTPITNLNFNDLWWIKEFAKKNDFIVRFDPIITPSNNGVKKNEEFQIDCKKFGKIIKEKIVQIEVNENFKNIDFFPCGAGRNLCAISSNGEVFPCLTFPYPLGNLKRSSFSDIWNSKLLENLRKNLLFKPDKCKFCNMINICGWCPGISYVYSSNFNFVYDLACLTSKVINDMYIKEEVVYGTRI
ncbi:MAG: radical SAM protein [Elusimicrobiales bacterium]|nr:radical SAM protein [Elusimicrobiales bacterium]